MVEEVTVYGRRPAPQTARPDPLRFGELPGTEIDRFLLSGQAEWLAAERERVEIEAFVFPQGQPVITAPRPAAPPPVPRGVGPLAVAGLVVSGALLIGRELSERATAAAIARLTPPPPPARPPTTVSPAADPRPPLSFTPGLRDLARFAAERLGAELRRRLPGELLRSLYDPRFLQSPLQEITVSAGRLPQSGVTFDIRPGFLRLPGALPSLVPLPGEFTAPRPFAVPDLVPEFQPIPRPTVRPVTVPFAIPSPNPYIGLPGPAAGPTVTVTPNQGLPSPAPFPRPGLGVPPRPAAPPGFRFPTPTATPTPIATPLAQPMPNPTRPGYCPPCKGEKKKDRKKEKQARAVCYRGSYVERSRSLTKRRRERIPCR